LSISEEARQVLREVGLNAYETDVYIALLKSGQMTAREISHKANVPYSKIYDVLNALKEKKWIKSVETRPAEYYPISPSEALATAKFKLEEEFRSWEQTIAKELQPLYEKREFVEYPDILILRGQQAVTAKLKEILEKASKEIVIAAPKFTENIVDSAILLLENLQKTHVSIQIMLAGEPEKWMKAKRLLNMGEMRTRDQMFGGGVIADGKEAMLFLGEEKPNLVIWSNHIGLVRFARDYFQFLWNSSNKI